MDSIKTLYDTATFGALAELGFSMFGYPAASITAKYSSYQSTPFEGTGADLIFSTNRIFNIY